MIRFFEVTPSTIYAVELTESLTDESKSKLQWVFNDAKLLAAEVLAGPWIGPRKEMITPWSTNAVEICQNLGVRGVNRIESYQKFTDDPNEIDHMLLAISERLDQGIFNIAAAPEKLIHIEDIKTYNESEGLALSPDEIDYLDGLSKELGRPLTDSEVFGFSQVNSEHCRHKIFNGTFILDGETQEESLFKMIKNTAKANGENLVSAYKDNVAFIKGPAIDHFAPKHPETSGYFDIEPMDSVISLKAETHNFPTTVEPFNGAATGAGGEIRDRMAGGKGSIPIAGTAVYMTSYSRLKSGKNWEEAISPRNWLYQSPKDILIKASNGASDFGNKFGQPLINGSLLTFEHKENGKTFAFDKVIMMAGGIGFGKFKEAEKDIPQKGDKVVLLGGDNYRIGMGGGAVSSVATGEFSSGIELQAVQRSNPEMQKRVSNVLRALFEMEDNPVVAIHDHGAGGHLNCFSELLEHTGGRIDIDQLPVGDPTLSSKEIIGNESQERMGLIVKAKDLELIEKLAARERAPMYVVGEITADMHLTYATTKEESTPIDLKLEHFFGKAPKTVLFDESTNPDYQEIAPLDAKQLPAYINQLLQLEAVACKDWLTNKVDRSVTGRVATQQTVGNVQLPLANLGVVTLDYKGKKGIASAIGHAPAAALVDAAKGSQMAIAKALTNIVWAELEGGLPEVSLSANWMWPAKNPGENRRLYRAVEAVSKTAIALGVNIPTGKDSLSMVQKYPDNEVVYSPGTVIISAVSGVKDIKKTVTPHIEDGSIGDLIYISFSDESFELAGSSFAQISNSLGCKTPGIANTTYFVNCFNAIQELISLKLIDAGHDVAAGGLITTLLEMLFSGTKTGMDLNFSLINSSLSQILLSEEPGVVIKTFNTEAVKRSLESNRILFRSIGKVNNERRFTCSKAGQDSLELNVNELRKQWFETSYLLDCQQTAKPEALSRMETLGHQPLIYKFPSRVPITMASLNLDQNRKAKSGVKAAIIREKGTNGDREMAYGLWLAGFDVKDVHMTDLINGREDLEDIQFLVFPGGFSNSDVLGSAKGWAGSFKFNEKAFNVLDKFFKRKDTLSLGVCNGCQLVNELDLIYPDHEKHPKLRHNTSGKFESAFVNVTIPENDSVLFKSLSGSRLGIWLAHGEGRFEFPKSEEQYEITAKYSYEAYPGNPNGSDFNTAAICSKDGRHLAIMPHFERSLFPWHWAHYPEERKRDELSPWILPFVDAKAWCSAQKK